MLSVMHETVLWLFSPFMKYTWHLHYIKLPLDTFPNITVYVFWVYKLHNLWVSEKKLLFIFSLFRLICLQSYKQPNYKT